MSVASTNGHLGGVLKIVIIYAIAGILWIYGSDTFLEWLVHDSATFTRIAIFKGIMFIILTSSLLFVLILRFTRQLKQSSDEFNAVIQTTKDGFYITDSAGRFLEVNNAYCTMIGYSRSELLTLGISDIEAREQPEEVAAHIARTLASGSDSFESQHRRKDGSTIDMEIGVTYLQDFGGRFYSFVRDTTDRKQAEMALQQSYSLLNNLSRQVPGILFKSYLHPDGFFETPYASSNTYDIYELSPEEIQHDNTAVFQRFHSDDREQVIASILESAHNLTPWKCEYRVQLPRQGLKWLYGVAQPQRMDDGTIAWYGFIMDITERKRVDDALTLKNFTLGTIADAIYWITPDARFWDVNVAAMNMLGYSHSQLLSMSIFDIGPEFPPERWSAHWEELKRNGSLQFETIHRTRDGRDIPVEVTATFCRYNDQEYNCAIARDISERRVLQDERIKVQKLESLGVLAGGIAHDFNNILTGIMGNISFARKFIDESNRAAKNLEQAETASKRAADLAHQLLTFAKGSQPIKKIVSAGTIIKASSELMLHGSNVNSSISIQDDLYAIDADEGQLSQALNNIIINAAQAMPDGGTICITAENTSLHAANSMLLAAGTYIRMTITDTGCGIPAEHQKKIFDPYFTTKTSGNGLGLASVYSIISKHGGHISVSSIVDNGTTFEILLPVGNLNSVETEAGQIAVQGGKHRSVLIMDDEKIIRDLTCDILTELEYQVQTCSNGDEAIALYSAASAVGQPFSAVIMDLTVPGGMGGREAAQHLLSIDPQACLIVSSGYSNDPVMAEFGRFGFSATIVKPYSMDEISKALDRALSAPRSATT
jgi:PAS domain S-box-containing protein